MFQQDGDHNKVRAEAKSKKHRSSKSVEELKSELNAIFEREEREGIKADPELIAEYVAAINDMESDKCSQARSHDDFEESWANFTKNHPDLFPTEKTKSRNWGKRVGRFVEVAILAATILAFTAAAFNWPDHIVEWGKELLRITPPPSGVMELVEPNTDGYSTLAEAVAGAGMGDVHTPTWVPARFSIKSLVIQELSSHTMITGLYTADESELIFRISRYPEAEDIPYFNFETNDDEKQNKVTKDGITYYYTENYETLRVTWKDGKCLYSISGEVSREEMERMVHSFYGG